MSSLEPQPPLQDTSSLGIVSTYIAQFCFIVLALSFVLMFYLAIKPCKYDHICELPPFGFFLFVIALVTCVVSLFGLFLAHLSPKIDTEHRVRMREQGIQWNASLFVLALLYSVFFIFAGFSGM